jgi:hypothetical protein
VHLAHTELLKTLHPDSTRDDLGVLPEKGASLRVETRWSTCSRWVRTLECTVRLNAWRHARLFVRSVEAIAARHSCLTGAGRSVSLLCRAFDYGSVRVSASLRRVICWSGARALMQQFDGWIRRLRTYTRSR